MSGRKGFTLVELLIVIVVIGVLAAMMMFSSTEAISSAKASNIVAGLTTFKKALISWYTDNYDKVYKDGKQYKLRNVDKGESNQAINNLGDLMKNNPSLVTRYISNSSQFTFDKDNYSSNAGQGSYRFEDSGSANNRNAWFVGYALSASDKSSGVAEKLVGRAKSANLLANQGTTGILGPNNKAPEKVKITPYAGGDIVWMKVLDLE